MLVEIVAIWFGAGLALALSSAFWSGFTFEWDPVEGVIFAFLWPLWLVLALAIGPFWLAFQAGRRAYYLKHRALLALMLREPGNG